ncbi:MAG: AMP-binding protein [Clostridia bacterium]|nr:AMP-binding protein [Clostridia bacterium]
MNLSFSTRGWASCSWEEWLDTATDMKFGGIEIYNAHKEGRLLEKSGPFHKYSISATVRMLNEKKLSIPCLDSSCDLSAEDGSAVEEVKLLMDIASDLRTPCVCAFASEQKQDVIEKNVAELLDYAAQKNVILLIKTSGVYADTAKLRELMNHFACDELGALWDVHHTCRDHKESPDETIKNLGAYVKHLHLRDSDDDLQYNLIGEGTLPIAGVMQALASINYDGFISLEWKPEWMEDLQDKEIIFPYFVNYMNRFESPRMLKKPLYYNQSQTGQYVWKKEALIETTFSRVLDRMVEEFPDQLAIKYTTLNYTRTYAEFREDVDNFARALIALGVKPGSHVTMWATNLPQWYIAFWATTKIGAVLVTMNTAYKIHEAEYLLKQSDTHTLILEKSYRDSDYQQIINELCPELMTTPKGKSLHAHRLPFLRNVISVGFQQPGAISWDDALERGKAVPVEEVWRLAANVSPHDVCNMQYTSGTTGFPKGVMLTHYNVVNNGKCIGDRMDLSTADRMMIQVPMFHCFGMVLAMTASMTHGATILPLPYFSPKPALACVHQEHITAFHGVPTMFVAMLEHPDFEKTDFSYMRTGIMAGSPCPIAKMREVVDKMHMKEITIVYGQTEASPGCTMSSADDPLELRVATVGRALPEIECRIINPETNEELPVGEIGEFVARGYNIMKGYYKMPDATRLAIDEDGWLHTGDLACKNEDGTYRITGRLKDMIIRGGENIYPKELEEFIYTHPKVSDVQVIGVPDEQYGEEIMACIILKEEEQMTVEEMKQYMRERIARHKVPKYIAFVDSFPMNAAGKILKYKMREQAIEQLKLQKAASIETA